MSSIEASVESFHSDTEELYPLEKHDSVIGHITNNENTFFKFKVRYLPQDTEKEKSISGAYEILVFASQKEKREGGIVFYQEKHSVPETDMPLYTLFVRARKIASEIAYNEHLHKCPYCGFLANDNWKIEKRWPLFTQRALKRVVPSLVSDDNVSTCAGLKQWVLPIVEVFKHKKDENPIFDYEELENCGSLLTAPGYPKWAYQSELDWYTNYCLQKTLDENPDAFEDDLDYDTIKRVVEQFDRTSDTKSLYK